MDELIPARKALAFVERMAFETFAENELHQNAVISLPWKSSERRPPTFLI